MMARERVFIDSNVALYLVGPDPLKGEVADRIMRDATLDRVISTQVIAEFVNVARHKTKLSWPNIRTAVEHVRAFCRMEQITGDVLDQAIDLSEANNFAWYDSIIVSSAIAAGASRLLSEDMQHGRKVRGLTIVNPFT